MSSSEKIGFFIHSMGGGGAEQMILDLVSEFHRRGFFIQLVLVKKEGELLAEVPEDIDIIEVGGSDVFTILPGMIQYFRNESPDTLLSTTERMNIIASLARDLSVSSTRLVLRVANVNSRRLRQGIKESSIPYIQQYTYARADHIIAISQGVADDVQKNTWLNVENITTIYNPAYPKANLSNLVQNQVQQLTKNDPHIVAAGRLCRQKGFDVLLHAHKQVVDNQVAHLTILGEGELREELKNLASHLNISEYVSLPGYVENPLEYMIAADLFVLSSRHEGFGNVIVEALACGTPVVATDCPSGPREILKNGEYGMLVPVENPDKLASAILSELASPIDKEKLKNRSKEFCVDVIADEYQDVLLA